MRKVFWALLIVPLLMWSTAGGVRAETLSRPVIAVLPFTNKAQQLQGMQYYDAVEMSAYLIDALKDADKFRVLEIDQMESVVNVQAYNSGQLTGTPGQLNAGRMLKAQYVVIGAILGEGTKTSELTYDNSAVGSAGGKKYKVETSVAVRIVDVETGEIMYSAIGRGQSASTGGEISFNQRKKTKVTTEVDEYGNEIPIENTPDPTVHTIRIGSAEVSSTQFVNAVENALDNAVFDKDRGLIAKIDGTSKRSRNRR